jgi:hypothetical protein
MNVPFERIKSSQRSYEPEELAKRSKKKQLRRGEGGEEEAIERRGTERRSN